MAALGWCWSVRPWPDFVVLGCPTDRWCCWWVHYALPVPFGVWFSRWGLIFGDLMLVLAGCWTGYLEHCGGSLSCLCRGAERSTLGIENDPTGAWWAWVFEGSLSLLVNWIALRLHCHHFSRQTNHWNIIGLKGVNESRCEIVILQHTMNLVRS